MLQMNSTTTINSLNYNCTSLITDQLSNPDLLSLSRTSQQTRKQVIHLLFQRILRNHYGLDVSIGGRELFYQLRAEAELFKEKPEEKLTLPRKIVLGNTILITSISRTVFYSSRNLNILTLNGAFHNYPTKFTDSDLRAKILKKQFLVLSGREGLEIWNLIDHKKMIDTVHALSNTNFEKVFYDEGYFTYSHENHLYSYGLSEAFKIREPLFFNNGVHLLKTQSYLLIFANETLNIFEKATGKLLFTCDRPLNQRLHKEQCLETKNKVFLSNFLEEEILIFNLKNQQVIRVPRDIRTEFKVINNNLYHFKNHKLFRLDLKTYVPTCILKPPYPSWTLGGFKTSLWIVGNRIIVFRFKPTYKYSQFYVDIFNRKKGTLVNHQFFMHYDGSFTNRKSKMLNHNIFCAVLSSQTGKSYHIYFDIILGKQINTTSYSGSLNGFSSDGTFALITEPHLCFLAGHLTHTFQKPASIQHG